MKFHRRLCLVILGIFITHSQGTDNSTTTASNASGSVTMKTQTTSAPSPSTSNPTLTCDPGVNIVIVSEIWCEVENKGSMAAAIVCTIFLFIVIIFVLTKRRAMSKQEERQKSEQSRSVGSTHREVSQQHSMREKTSDVSRSLQESVVLENREEMKSPSENLNMNPVPEEVEMVDNVLYERSPNDMTEDGNPYGLAEPVVNDTVKNTGQVLSRVSNDKANAVYDSTDDDEEMVMVDNELYESS